MQQCGVLYAALPLQAAFLIWQAAFLATMDIEFNPKGVVNAMLQVAIPGALGLEHVRTDLCDRV